MALDVSMRSKKRAVLHCRPYAQLAIHRQLQAAGSVNFHNLFHYVHPAMLNGNEVIAGAHRVSDVMCGYADWRVVGQCSSVRSCM